MANAQIRLIRTMHRRFVILSLVAATVASSAAMSCSANDSIAVGGDDMLRGVLWKTADNPTGFINYWNGSPKAYAGRVYVIRSADIISLDALDGHEIWRQTIARPGVRLPKSILAIEGNVYVASGDSLYSFDAVSGAKRWAVQTVHDYSECEGSVDDQAIYVCSFEHRAAAYNRANGAQLWSIVLSPATALPAWVSGSALSGDTLYLASRRDLDKVLRVAEVTAIDRRTGKEIWLWTSSDTHTSGAGSPALVGRLLVLDDEDGNAVFALDRFTQKVQWRILGDPEAFGPKGTPAIVGDTAYVASADRFVYAIHIPTGTLLWRTMAEGSYLSVAACANKVFANDFGLDVRDRKAGAVIDRIIASRENQDYAYGGIGTDGARIYVTSPVGTYAVVC